MTSPDVQVKLEKVTLSEPNTLLLDYCSYSFNDEDFSPPEEVMRIDQILRRRLGYFTKGAKIRQPHTIPVEKRKPAGSLKLRFVFTSEIEVTGASLAIEDPESVNISLDGRDVPSTSSGWWVDEDIHTVPLPPLTARRHTLQVEYQYGPLTNLERLFILGDFGVSVRGRTATIVKLELGKMEWGDITRQDLPFYTGNITYHGSFVPPKDGEEVAIRVAHSASPAVAVDLNEKRVGLLVHQPRAAYLGKLSGQQKINFTVFGNRHNAFGPLHLTPNKTNWLGADAWRTDYDWWSEEYVLGQVGILNAPRVEVRGREIPALPRRGITLYAI